MTGDDLGNNSSATEIRRGRIQALAFVIGAGVCVLLCSCFTISDFVADLRAPTPSAAAEMVSGAREDLQVSVRSLYGRLRQAIRSGIERRRLHLERLAHNRAFSVAPNRIRDLQQRFDETTLRLHQALQRFVSDRRHREYMASTSLNKVDLSRFILHKKDAWTHCRQRLTAGIQSYLHRNRARFELAVGKMDSLSPLAILKRGFSLCRDEQGVIIKNATDVSRGDSVHVTLSEGELDCLVQEARQSE